MRRRRLLLKVVAAEAFAVVVAIAGAACTVSDPAPSGGIFGDRPRSDLDEGGDDGQTLEGGADRVDGAVSSDSAVALVDASDG